MIGESEQPRHEEIKNEDWMRLVKQEDVSALPDSSVESLIMSFPQEGVSQEIRIRAAEVWDGRRVGGGMDYGKGDVFLRVRDLLKDRKSDNTEKI